MNALISSALWNEKFFLRFPHFFLPIDDYCTLITHSLRGFAGRGVSSG